MKILFVSYRFPPIVTSESLLIPRVLWSVDQMDWRVTALTATLQSCNGTIDNTLMKLIPASTEMARVRSFERFLVPFHSLPYKILTMFGMTSYSDLWYFPAVIMGRTLLNKNNFDLIYSRASTWTSNVVGLVLKRYSNLPWVAHFSDPWVDNPYVFPGYNLLQRSFAKKMEASIIREADAVVYTSRQTVEAVMAKYPKEWIQKVHSIPHGYDPRVYPGVSPSSSLNNKKLRLMHSGKFFGPRTPLSLFKALAILNQGNLLNDKLELIFIGPIENKYKISVEDLGLSEIVKFVDEIPFDKTIEQLSQADVLLLIEAGDFKPSIFLPSKIIDYLPLKKPILGITPLQGASADLLRKIDCPIVDPNDIQGISKIISELIDQFNNGSLQISSAFVKNIAEYDIRNQTNKLNTIFLECIKSSRLGK